MLQPLIQRLGLLDILFIIYEVYPRVGITENYVSSVIRRTIVDDNKFKICKRLS